MTILKYYDETDGTWKPFVNNANDAVTLSGDQTIAGKKTFTDDVDVDGDLYSNGEKVATYNPNGKILSSLLDFTGNSSMGSSGHIIIGGLQICWGKVNSDGNGAFATFDRAFGSHPYAALCTHLETTSSTANYSFIRSVSATQINMKVSSGAGNYRDIFYIVIGEPS